jgi:serine/threonine protein kinase
VAEVLAAAHRRGLAHRDIKPDNVFLHRAGGEEVVKVVDFGIAKFFGDPDGTAAARLTRTGEYMGTPSYSAPERMHCEADDGRSDVFSLGALLYQMVCGAPPWTRPEQLKMTLGEELYTPPRPMAEFRPGVPPALEDLTRRALRWSWRDRPTAAEFAAELARLEGGLDDSVPDGPRPPPPEPAPTDVTPGTVPAPASGVVHEPSEQPSGADS